MSLKKVLIIDDETDLCILLKNFFTKRHYEVVVTHKLSDGLKEALDFSPDLIFLDNNLPDSQGWTKAEWFLETMPKTEIFLISAYKAMPSLPDDSRLTIIEKPLSLKAIEKLLSEKIIS
jgi:two-component system response regulator HydG